MTIGRRETPADHAAVYQVTAWRSGTTEAVLVNRLRGSSGSISLVATEAGSIVGHILYTPVTIEGPASHVRAAGLGPMAVVPNRQRSGIGTSLVQGGLEECRRLGYQAVVVVGHPSYYRQQLRAWLPV